MKLIKGFLLFFAFWIFVLYMLFGPAVLLKMKQTKEITNAEELRPYHGFIVDDLEKDWFGNWVFAQKGGEEVVFRCSDSLYSKLVVDQKIGN